MGSHEGQREGEKKREGYYVPLSQTSQAAQQSPTITPRVTTSRL